MANSRDISASRLLKILLQSGAESRCIDVRSPGEFAHGSIPFFFNIPILDNEERHQVGLCYKQKGQDSAILLGHNLVAKHRDALVANWKSYLGDREHAFVCCWRGGLRSRTAQDWILASGGKVQQVVGGYKSMRRELLKSFDHLPELLIISGPTGSGKTRLLESLGASTLNLEKIAKHRGSAFGQMAKIPQPPQANFENQIGFELLGISQKVKQYLFLEDESIMIGGLHLPLAIYRKMILSPVVQVRESIEKRSENIFKEYVEQVLASGVSPLELQQSLEDSVLKIARKLGGQKTSEVITTIRLAMISKNPDLHREWIRNLLEHYYDKAYAYSFKKSQRSIIFQGDWNECHNWIQSRFA